MDIDKDVERRVMKTLAPLVALYPHWGAGKDTIKSYVIVLADVEPAALQAAIGALMTEQREFMPGAAMIRSRAMDILGGANDLPTEYDALEIAFKAVRDGRGHPIHGQSKEWDIPPIVDQAVRMIGGWTSLAMSENPVSDRARFVDAYRMVRERQVKERLLLPDVQTQMKALADVMSNPGQLKRLANGGENAED